MGLVKICYPSKSDPETNECTYWPEELFSYFQAYGFVRVAEEKALARKREREREEELRKLIEEAKKWNINIPEVSKA